ncbi:MAG: isoprenylcysteine carboxylmethyltransferase family protein [Oligoflexales bacterium]
MQETPAYGLWSLVILNSLVFIIFAFSFAKPQSKRDWRSFGAFSGFIVALFVEMYGFPLSIYLLAGWLGDRFPKVNLLSHDNGHLWHTLLGLKGNPHWDILHILSNVLIFGGFILLANSWSVLFKAQKDNTLALTGPYSRVRHPQYVGFIAIMAGFLLQWPTIPTLIMFPILVWMYVRLAKKEEKEVRTQFGTAYDEYAAATPAFFPKIGNKTGTRPPSQTGFAHSRS